MSVHNLKPGHVEFAADEIEWLLAHLVTVCNTLNAVGIHCDPADVQHRIIEKLDRARFVDAEEFELRPETGAKILAVLNALPKRD